MDGSLLTRMRDIMEDALPDQCSRHVFKASQIQNVDDAHAVRSLTDVWITKWLLQDDVTIVGNLEFKRLT